MVTCPLLVICMVILLLVSVIPRDWRLQAVVGQIGADWQSAAEWYSAYRLWLRRAGFRTGQRSVPLPEQVHETRGSIEILHQPDVRLHAVDGSEKTLAVRMQAEPPIPKGALIVGQIEPWRRRTEIRDLAFAAPGYIETLEDQMTVVIGRNAVQRGSILRPPICFPPLWTDGSVLLAIRANHPHPVAIPESNPIAEWRPLRRRRSTGIGHKLRWGVRADSNLENGESSTRLGIVRDPVAIRRPGRSALGDSSRIVPKADRRLSGKRRDPDLLGALPSPEGDAIAVGRDGAVE